MKLFESNSSAIKISSALLAALAMAFALSACGSSDSADNSIAVSAYPGVQTDQSVADLVPAKYKGEDLTAASTFGLPPMEFIDGTTAAGDERLTGADIDLSRAMASTMGLKIVFEDVPFEQLLSGVKAGTYDLAVSSITDNKEREAEVDFVTYFMAGSRFYGPTKSSPVESISEACGKTASVVRGTIYDELFADQASKCPKGRALRIRYPSNQDGIDQELINGDADVTASDTPIASWAVRNSGGKLREWGKPFAEEPYGMAVAKESGLARPIRAALAKLIADGTYSAILEKWGLQAGAISEPEIDGAVR